MNKEELIADVKKDIEKYLTVAKKCRLDMVTYNAMGLESKEGIAYWEERARKKEEELKELEK